METQKDLVSVLKKLNEVPTWVNAWKKSAAWSGAFAHPRSLQEHGRGEAEEAPSDEQENLKFEDFMETFTEASNRITDGIDLETFIDQASPPPEA